MFAQSSKGEAKAGPLLAPLDLARQIEARDPRVQVTYLPLASEPGGTLAFGVEPNRDPSTGKLFELALQPGVHRSGDRRRAGAARVGRGLADHQRDLRLVPLRAALHPAHPEMWGVDRWGIWLLGGVAILWTLDCFVGFYLTLPPRQKASVKTVGAKSGRGFWARWKPAWVIKTSASAYRINFDIHRAFGLWLWGVLFTVAFTGLLAEPLYRGVLPGHVEGLEGDAQPLRPAHAGRPRLADHRHPHLRPSAGRGARPRRPSAAGRHRPAGPSTRPEYGIYGVRLPRARRRSRRGRRGPTLSLLRRQDRCLAGRLPALEGHRGRHLRPGPVPAALGTHPRDSRAHPDLADRRGGGGAQRDRRGHLAEEAQGAGGRQARAAAVA